MRIGEVARRSGMSVDAVRYYERRGLIAPAQRMSSGYRDFSDGVPDRLIDIKMLQDLGLSLDQIQGIVDRAGADEVSCHHVDGTLTAVIDQLEARIRELTQVRDRAVETQAACRDGSCGRSGTAAAAGCL